MKTTLQYALLGFAVFLVVGAYKGIKSRQERPWEIQAAAARAIAVNIGTFEVELAYECPGAPRLRYELSRGVLLRDPSVAEFVGASVLPALADHIEVVGNVAGSAGFTLATINTINMPASQRAQRVAAFVLGAITGYSAGYWLTSRAKPQCADPEVLEWAMKKESWRDLSRHAWSLQAQSRTLRIEGKGTVIHSVVGVLALFPEAIAKANAISIDQVGGTLKRLADVDLRSLEMDEKSSMSAEDFRLLAQGHQLVKKWVETESSVRLRYE